MDSETRKALEESIQQRMGYPFQNWDLAIEALTHSSYANELAGSGQGDHPNNERLEFLGDAVVGLLIARLLMDRFPKATEGSLSRWRSTLVSRRTLAEIANSLDLGEMVLLGKGEKQTGGAQKRSILAGTIEAVIGAIYLDAGIEAATEFVERVCGPWVTSLEEGGDKKARLMDRKTHLQERTQSVYQSTPIYRVVESWGPEHQKQFRVEIILNEKVVACGEGRSKKEAEQAAAGKALEVLGL